MFAPVFRGGWFCACSASLQVYCLQWCNSNRSKCSSSVVIWPFYSEEILAFLWVRLTTVPWIHMRKLRCSWWTRTHKCQCIYKQQASVAAEVYWMLGKFPRRKEYARNLWYSTQSRHARHFVLVGSPTQCFCSPLSSAKFTQTHPSQWVSGDWRRLRNQLQVGFSVCRSN